MSKFSNRGLSTDRLILGALLLIAASRFVRRRRKRTLPYTPYNGPAGGWGSAKGVASILVRERVLLKGARLLMRQNKSKGFACVSCAWAKPKSHGLEFCENGAKATAWEIDAHRATPEFFRERTVTELLTWSDYQLESQGRLTHPLNGIPLATDTCRFDGRMLSVRSERACGLTILNLWSFMPPAAPLSRRPICTL